MISTDKVLAFSLVVFDITLIHLNEHKYILPAAPDALENVDFLMS